MKKNAVIHITLVGLAAVALFILPNLWGRTGLPILIIAALVTVTVIMVRWHARNTGYKCPECEFTIAVSPLADFLSPHKSGEKMLRCPRCLRSSWFFEIGPASVTDDATATDGHGTHHGYRSRIYRLVTIFVAAFLLMAIWIEYSQVRHLL